MKVFESPLIVSCNTLSERTIFDAGFTRHVFKFFIYYIKNFNIFFPASGISYYFVKELHYTGLTES